MKLAYFQANLMIHAAAPERIKLLSSEEVLAAALLLPDPAVDYPTWLALMKALLQQPPVPVHTPEELKKEQMAEVESLANDPVLKGIGVQVQGMKKQEAKE